MTEIYPWPHLILGVHCETDSFLRLFLLTQNSMKVFQRPLGRRLSDQMQKLRGHLGDLPVDGDAETLYRRLEGLGANLAQDLLPMGLCMELLARSARGRLSDGRAPELWIVSDESLIPWELVRPTDGMGRGSFLAEGYALSRWPWDLEAARSVALDPLAMVVPDTFAPPQAETEAASLAELARRAGWHVQRVSPLLANVLNGFRSQSHAAWHFITHGTDDKVAPQLSYLTLGARGAALFAADLKSSGVSMSHGEKRTLIFLNSCLSGAGTPALRGVGGLAQSFVEAGAAAVVGTQWAISGQFAAPFAHAFYESLGRGESIAESVRRARLKVRGEFPGDPSWLGYSLYAHPAASLNSEVGPSPPLKQPELYLEIPDYEWHPGLSPGALLRADHGAVPFHGRESELDEFLGWCTGDSFPVSVRLLTGPGGMGKTRLALEICRRLRLRGWRAGFVPASPGIEVEVIARDLAAKPGPLLAVVDYAETRRDFVVHLVRHLYEARGEGPFRLLLLARGREDWWGQLKRQAEPVGSLIAGAATDWDALGPLAQSLNDRLMSYRLAVEGFAKKLEKPVPEAEPEKLGEAHFEVALMIHISALSAVEGVPVKDEDGILDWILHREERFWQQQLISRELPEGLLAGIRRAMCAITLASGWSGEEDTIALLRALKHFEGQTYLTLSQVACLLRDTYPGEWWVMPLQPDIVGEHLVERELDQDPQEILDLVMGPRIGGGKERPIQGQDSFQR